MEPHDWNFDSIPDHHLIACRYWEYARESAFLKKFKSRCDEANRNPQPLSQAFDFVGKDARMVFSIGTVANSFLLGFGFDPEAAPNPATAGAPGSIPHSQLSTHHSQLSATGDFPAAWQSLSEAEKDFRAQLAAGVSPSPLASTNAICSNLRSGI